ncbi:hypothetical protein C8Q80DRAFT_1124690 [Daedaleopsis nitida]|nr:hypothetical protein C8Q80DRAFT_1124690 [Daedaleopsis nitida]
MSFSPDSDTAELIAAYDSLSENLSPPLSDMPFLKVSFAVLLVYECVISIGSEVEYFWKGKLAVSAVLYLLNKYLALTVALLSITVFLPIFTEHRVYNLYLGLSETAFSALRAFALSKTRLLSIFVFLLSVVPFGINITQYFTIGVNGDIDPVFGCINDSEFTVTQIVDIPKQNILSRTYSIQSTLLRDGTVYFSILVALNALHLTFSLTSIYIPSQVFGNGLGSYVSVFTGPCTAILVSRFMLHLQESASRTLRVASDSPLHLSVNSSEDAPSFVKVQNIRSIAHRAVTQEPNSELGLDPVEYASTEDVSEQTFAVDLRESAAAFDEAAYLV